MPVIGRLDGQADEVIIRPISGRRREEPPPQAPKNQQVPETSDPPPRAPVQTPDADESSAGAGELPVWLL